MRPPGACPAAGPRSCATTEPRRDAAPRLGAAAPRHGGPDPGHFRAQHRFAIAPQHGDRGTASLTRARAGGGGGAGDCGDGGDASTAQVKHGSNAGPILVKHGSNTGQTPVKFWLKFWPNASQTVVGQKKGGGGEKPGLGLIVLLVCPLV